MQYSNAWLLPDGIDEILPDQTRHLECLRGRLLRLFDAWGYELVIPPFIDYLDSLLTGSGHDLALQTFTLTDQISGKLLGVRADMTPQVARIDARHLNTDYPNRLCYVGTILHTRGDALEKNRSPMQIGAELYGHAGQESDLEVIRLMLETLAITGLLNVHLDLGHVGIYRALCQQAGLSSAQESQLFDVLQRKARPELAEMVEGLAIDEALKQILLKLPELNGGLDTLDKAMPIFANANAQAQAALAELKKLAVQLSRRYPNLPISCDLAELRGYHYHTGVVFAAFVPGVGREIARGGRYDNIGEVFGRARPATGFSADLKVLSGLTLHTHPSPLPEKIFAPFQDDSELERMISQLRAEGHTVLQELPGQSGNALELGCTAVLDRVQSVWTVKSLTILE